MSSVIKYGKIYMYADDTTLSVSTSDVLKRYFYETGV